MFFNDETGQLSMEFIILIGFVLVLVILAVNVINTENELNTAISGARNGVMEGISINSLAIYPKTTYDGYAVNNSFLTYPKSIKLLKIEQINQGFDSNYNKTKIQLKIYVSSSYNILNRADKESIGDRINFNARKSIATIFKTTNLSNALYNPAFSNNYRFTTANVQWV
ncbi:hypothetical protein [Methanobrevibacter filiformis]|uniref:Class III signal peptide n=1 Tax=Methanobrevibacter filiformis TaxID=55758 RepID=A0A166D1Z7_9EURY|nr:hypothetical protein [Methanobrevibacter filiformis]KZX15120.1 hypothetical protein MBFIL_07210 [Methanobrevibacter filiformis]